MSISADTQPLAFASASALVQLRPQQTAMIDAVLAAWQAGLPVAVEAPTGTGKTYAYLAAALQRGERVVISTATRALQDQLLDQDIPALLGYLQLQRKRVVLKGRENYLCLHGLVQARSVQQPADLQASLADIERWAQSTRSGDLAELADIAQLPRLVPRITASHSECLGRRCDYYERCFSNQARDKAAQADVLVINHHLFFSELRHRQMLGAEHGFVPLAPTMVMDEAHQLQPIGLRVLAKGLNVADVQDYLRQVARHTQQYARGFAPWAALLAACDAALRQWQTDASQQPVETDAFVDVPQAPGTGNLLVALHNRISAVVAALQVVEQSAAPLATLVGAGQALLANLRQWAQPPAPGMVRWWEGVANSGLDANPTQGRAGRQGFRESPLWLWQALAAMRADVRAATWLADEPAVPARNWLFTSATLGGDDTLQWFAQGMGLRSNHDAVDASAAHRMATVRLAHSFDWKTNAALVVPDSLPSVLHSAAVRAPALAAWLQPYICQLGGRSMVLCTSVSAMQATAAALRQVLQGSGVQVLQQGDQPKRRLLRTMRAVTKTAIASTGYVLVGTMGLWEGVDLPGRALQLLVIDKLPFPARHDVLHTQRSQALSVEGGDGFWSYVLPHTAMQLRQGVGRLLRSPADRGLVVIADDRLTQQSYGPELLAALPPMPLLAEGEVAAYIEQRLLGGHIDTDTESLN